MSRGKTAGSQAEVRHRKRSKKLLGYTDSPQFISLCIKENLLDVTTCCYIKTGKITSNTPNYPKQMPLEKVIPTKYGIRLPFGITNGERVM
jgi:hypothetical protein